RAPAILHVGLALGRRTHAEGDCDESMAFVKSAGRLVALKSVQAKLTRRTISRLAEQRSPDAAALMSAKDGDVPNPWHLEGEHTGLDAIAIGDPDLAVNENTIAKKRRRFLERVALVDRRVGIAYEIGLVPARDQILEISLGKAPYRQHGPAPRARL